MVQKFPYSGNILMIGYGSVGRCTMPLIEKHFDFNSLSRVTVVDGHDHRADAQRSLVPGAELRCGQVHGHRSRSPCRQDRSDSGVLSRRLPCIRRSGRQNFA